MDWSTATRRAALVATLLLTALAAAAEPAAEPEDAGYRIGRGDVVEVQVWREPDLSGRFTIDESGALPHMLVGSVPAAGATLPELRDRIVGRLEADYLREARVGVSLVASARRKASVLGAVAAPGLYPIGDGMRVLELLFASGGVTAEAGATALLKRFEPAPDGASPPAARRPRVIIRIDLDALLRRGDLRQNVQVTAGDVLVVEGAPQVAAPPPEQVGRVRVVGEVEQPGVYPLDQAGTVLDAVLAAGGLTDYASGNRAKLVRRGDGAREESRLRLDDVMEGDPEAENPPLRDGDLIVVPESFF